jgi:hypothetical protein
MGRSIILFVTVLVTALLLTACTNPTSDSTPTPEPTPALEPQSPTPSPPQEIEGKEYSNSEYGFSVQYPSDWKLYEDYGAAVVAFEGPRIKEEGITININIGLEKLYMDVKPTIEEYIADTRPSVEAEFENVNWVEEYNTTIAGWPAIISTFTCNYEDMILMLTQASFIAGRDAYIINYTATPLTHEQYCNCLDLVTTSFEVEPTSEPTPPPAETLQYKTFSKYGFSFDYPKGFDIVEMGLYDSEANDDSGMVQALSMSGEEALYQVLWQKMTKGTYEFSSNGEESLDFAFLSMEQEGATVEQGEFRETNKAGHDTDYQFYSMYEAELGHATGVVGIFFCDARERMYFLMTMHEKLDAEECFEDFTRFLDSVVCH